MNNDQGFAEEIADLAERLDKSVAAGPKTAWDLKLELRVPHTTLHLALGRLLAQGRIRIQPDAFTLHVEAAAAPAAAKEPPQASPAN
ncbi:MAG: hypothetical protein WCU88_13350 [Elusimicrobiota bacterium]|jgi:hypothetical protein